MFIRSRDYILRVYVLVLSVILPPPSPLRLSLGIPFTLEDSDYLAQVLVGLDSYTVYDFNMKGRKTR